MAVCQNLVPLVNIKIAGKWMFIPLKMVCVGIDPYPYIFVALNPTDFRILPWKTPKFSKARERSQRASLDHLALTNVHLRELHYGMEYPLVVKICQNSY
jgi:hypothetical protein